MIRSSARHIKLEFGVVRLGSGKRRSCLFGEHCQTNPVLANAAARFNMQCWHLRQDSNLRPSEKSARPFLKGQTTSESQQRRRCMQHQIEAVARWAAVLRDASADVVMTERVAGHGDAMWREEFPVMVASAFGGPSFARPVRHAITGHAAGGR